MSKETKTEETIMEKNIYSVTFKCSSYTVTGTRKRVAEYLRSARNSFRRNGLTLSRSDILIYRTWSY